MGKYIFICILWIATAFSASAKSDSLTLKRIYNEVLANGVAYDWLDYLSNNIGGRLSGSPEAEAAVIYTREMLDTLGLDTVWLQPVMVPHWVRGDKEQARIISAQHGTEQVNITALGGSIGTGDNGLTANVVEVRSFEEADSLGEKLRGKIVFYNVPMEPTDINTFRSYGHCSPYRWRGAANAGKYGAKGVIVRSLSHKIDKHPHTGSMAYSDDPTIPKLPAAAISTYDAELLSRQLKSDPDLQFFYRMTCETLPDVLSYNVIGEMKGSQYPEEIIVVGGHLDSWDNGDGAHDDGAGCVQSMEVLRTYKALGMKPKRTIRVVLFMNEENGARGGREYAAEALRKGEKHIAAIESDAGGFSPRGFGINDTLPVIRQIQQWLPLFEPYYIHILDKGYGGVDINFLKSQGTTCIGLVPDSQRYFDHHHAETDTFDAVNKRELHLGAASMASLIWLISEYGLQKAF